ncbi:MAG TPA: hypothetical protein VK483_01730 [Chitinophagaceae bacterium]|nr:hypothetical protein [Chitinophagaceae bacterium]
MRLFISLLSIFIIIAVACNKDKFQTKPTIKIKSLNTEYIPLNGSLIIRLECTDKEGDVQDSVIIIKRRLNRRVVPTLRDTLRYKFPDFPNAPRTEVIATLDYQTILSAISPPIIPGSNPPQKELDTLILKMAVRDRAGHVSDTITSNQIIVFRQ